MFSSWRVEAAFQILASYFITVPLRDEMGVLLGTATLPKLVGSSVLLSMVCQAATSSLLDTRNHASITKAAALRTLFRRLSLCIFVFAFAVLLTVDAPPTTYPDGSKNVLHMGRALYQAANDAQPPPRPVQDSPPGTQFSVVMGDSTLSQPRKILFIVFYLWMGIQNLLAGSVMWARCADVFPAASAPRVFGVIAAAATFGQLIGAIVVQLLSRSVSGRMPIWLQGLLLSLSAICMFMVSLMISHLEPVHIPPAKLTLNLEALDLQHVQTPSPQQVGTTLERRNSAGPTSLPPASTLPHLPISLSPRGPRTTTPGGAAPVVLARGTPRSARGGDRSTVIGDWGEDSPAFTGVRAERPESLNGSPPYTPTGAPPWGDHKHRRSLSRRSASASRKGVRGHQPPLRGLRAWRACLLWTLPWMRQTVEAFALIARSATLRHMSMHLVCSYLISSLLYFTRASIFASALHGSGSRLRWFSAGNALSALLILLLQLFATGGAIRWAGVAVALVSVPLTCFFSTVVLAMQPVPVVLVLAETARKVVSYSFAKPAREMLFTQLSSDVKYKSKLVLDTVVQRGGDALGAALFSVLDAHSVSSSTLAASCSFLSLLWAVVAYTLGRRFDRRLRRPTQASSSHSLEAQ